MWLSDADGAHAVRHAELNEIHAWRDLYAAAPPAWSHQHGLRSHQPAGQPQGLALVFSGLPVPLFNRVLGLGLDLGQGMTTPDALDSLSGLAALYADLPPQTWMAQPAPGPYADFIEGRLAALGYVRTPQRWVKTGAWLTPAYVHQLTRQLAHAPHPDLPASASSSAGDFDVHEISPALAHDFAAPIVRGMGLPPWMSTWIEALCGRSGWHTYVAYVQTDTGREPAAAAALYCAEGRGWLGMATTRPEFRRRGAQRALMLRRLLDAQHYGARFASVETGEPLAGQPSPSYHNMLGCGLKPLAWRNNWMLG